MDKFGRIDDRLISVWIDDQLQNFEVIRCCCCCCNGFRFSQMVMAGYSIGHTRR